MRTIKFITVLLLCSASVAVVRAQTPALNKAAVMKAYDYVNGRDWASMGALLADNITDYAAPAPLKGRDAVVNNLKAMVTAFPDFKITAQKSASEGNTVMVLVEVTGTFKNDFMGMTATGKSFRIMDVDIVEFDAAGKAVAHWGVQDPMVMMSQIMK